MHIYLVYMVAHRSICLLRVSLYILIMVEVDRLEAYTGYFMLFFIITNIGSLDLNLRGILIMVDMGNLYTHLGVYLIIINYRACV